MVFLFKRNIFDPEISPKIFQPFWCSFRSKKMLILCKGADFLRKKKPTCVYLCFFAFVCVYFRLFVFFCVAFFRGPDAFSGMPWLMPGRDQGCDQ